MMMLPDFQNMTLMAYMTFNLNEPLMSKFSWLFVTDDSLKNGCAKPLLMSHEVFAKCMTTTVAFFSFFGLHYSSGNNL